MSAPADELERTVNELRADLGHLRRELAGEVRTRHLVVVDEDGFERVEVAATGSFGHVKVNCRSDEHAATYAALEASEKDGPMASAYLVGRGNVRASFDVIEDEEGACKASIDVDPPEPPVNWMTPTSCACSEEFEGIQEMQHEWLLSIEEEGAAGIASLVEYLASDQEVGTDQGFLRWGQFSDFVAAHNWRDPMAMFRLAAVLDLLLQTREKWWSTKTGGAR